MSVSVLYRVPPEIIQNVAFQVVFVDDPRGRPASLTPLLCTSKYLNSVLAFGECHHLWARIFSAMFDTGSAKRRFGDDIYDSDLAHQLRKYCTVLKHIRIGDIHSPHVLELFWMAFLMLCGNDGKNRCQLDRVNFNDFVDRFVRTRVYETRYVHNGWPAENAINSLALWLFWMNTNIETLLSEPEPRRQQIIAIVLPYVLLPFRYPASQAPPNHFRIPLCEEFERQYPHSMITAHGPYPLYREPSQITQSLYHFGRPFDLSVPLITVAAKLIYFSRREAVPFFVPNDLPVNRLHAASLGHFEVRPTQEDIIEVNAHTDTKLVPRTKWNWREDFTEEELELEDRGIFNINLKSASSKWDNDWMRWSYCSNPWIPEPMKGTVYSMGTLTGLWQGRMLIPNEVAHMQLVSTPEYPPGFSEHSPHVSTVPIFMRLREHHCISPRPPVDMGGVENGLDDGLGNAYFPPLRVHESEIDVSIHANGEEFVYETYVPGQPNSHDENTCHQCLYRSSYDEDFASVGIPPEDEDECENGICTGIMDIIFTGKTDMRHGQAWNHFTYIGRVRTWDGLIAILRVPLARHLGKVIFYGYIVGGQNFVGNWRIANGVDMGVPAWESAFSMSRRDD